jgi:hypothetical protein
VTLEPQLTPWEHTRQAAHRSIDRITATWPRAQNDADARGYPTGIDYNARTAGSENTSVEVAALNQSHAVAWLAELADLVCQLIGAYRRIVDTTHTRDELTWRNAPWTPATARIPLHGATENLCTTWPPTAEHTIRSLIRLANTGTTWWPPTPATGTTHAGVTVGKFQRGSNAETCLYCHVLAHPGDRRAIKTPAGEVEGYVHTSPCWYAVTVSRGIHPRQTKICKRG